MQHVQNIILKTSLVLKSVQLLTARQPIFNWTIKKKIMQEEQWKLDCLVSL